jgi:hypothetical protein
VARIAAARRQQPPVDIGQPPPPGSPAYCPPGASSSPFPLCFYGGHVLHSNSVYTVFWQPSALPSGVSAFSSSYLPVVNGFFHNVAAASGQNNIYEVGAQYFDATGSAAYQSSFGGSAIDTNPYPPNAGFFGGCPPNLSSLEDYCLTDDQLASELDKVITAHGWPRGLGPVYLMFLPAGVDACVPSGGAPQCSYDVFCAYHSAFQAGNGPATLYAVLPYAAVQGCDTADSRGNVQHPNGSDADAVLDTASHEHNEAITDPLGDGWLDVQGNENGDKCQRVYGQPLGSTPFGAFDQTIGGGDYFIQSEWSNATANCQMSLANLPPRVDFTTSANPVAGRPVTFVASASVPGGSVTSLTWGFGDGSPATGGARAVHTFAATGAYTVVLTAVAGSGLLTIVSHQITVGSAAARSSTARLVKRFGLSPRQSLHSAARNHALGLTIVCRRACAVHAGLDLRVGRRLIALGSGRRTIAHGGTLHLTVKLSGAALGRLQHAAKRSIAIILTARPKSGRPLESDRKNVALRR